MEKHETPMSTMIDYLERQIEMLDALELGKSDPLKLALEMANEIKDDVETPMLKGIYQEGRWDQWHSDPPKFESDQDFEGAEKYERFIEKEANDFYSDCFIKDAPPSQYDLDLDDDE